MTGRKKKEKANPRIQIYSNLNLELMSLLLGRGREGFEVELPLS